MFDYEVLEDKLMPKFPSQKLRLLHVMRYLQEETDELHSVTLNDICAELKKFEISCDRKSIYMDIDALRQSGMDIVLTKGNHFGYFVANRKFELPELKLLVDAVQSSRFITAKKSNQLIGKLESLASVHEGKKLKRQVFVDGRIKAPNESIYYSIDKLYEAIAANRQVTFKYFEYTLNKTMCFRRNGNVYQVSPYALHWDGDNYYLIAHNPEHGITHFRVDKTFEVQICNAERSLPDENLDIVKYVQQSFSMFGGEKDTVTIHFANELIGVAIDRFGKDITIRKVDKLHFAADVQANISPTFLSWVFQFAGKAVITGPEMVIGQMKQMLDQQNSLYFS